MDEDETTGERIVAPDHWLQDEYTAKLRRQAKTNLENCFATLRSACAHTTDPDVRERFTDLTNAENNLAMLMGLEP